VTPHKKHFSTKREEPGRLSNSGRQPLNNFASICSKFVRTVQGLSIFAGAISIFWLAILGDWGPIVYGVALLIAGARFLLMLLDLPAVGLGLICTVLIRSRFKIGAIPFLFLGRLYTAVLMAAWCTIIYLYFMDNTSDRTAVPSLIWSFVVATGPWAHMALWQERHGDPPAASGVMEVMALQAAYLVLMMITIGWAANPLAATAVLSSVMLLTSSLVSARNAKIIMR